MRAWCTGAWECACMGAVCMQGSALARGLDTLAYGSVLAQGGCVQGSALARGLGAPVQGRVLAQALCACAAACLHRGCVYSHRNVLAQGLDVHLHRGECARTGLCSCTGAVCAHGGRVPLHKGCVLTPGARTPPSHASLRVPLTRELARGQDTRPCPRSSGARSLARGCLCTRAAAGYRLLCSREGVCAPRTGTCAEVGGAMLALHGGGPFAQARTSRFARLQGCACPLRKCANSQACVHA